MFCSAAVSAASSGVMSHLLHGYPESLSKIPPPRIEPFLNSWYSPLCLRTLDSWVDPGHLAQTSRISLLCPRTSCTLMEWNLKHSFQFSFKITLTFYKFVIFHEANAVCSNAVCSTVTY